MSEMDLGLTDDEIEAAFDEIHAKVASGQEVSAEATPKPEEPAGETPATEEQPEGETPVEETAEAAAPTEGSESTEDEIARLEREELEARTLEAEARARKFEQIAGGHGGKIGFLERQIAELRSHPVPSAPAPEDNGYAQDQQVQPPPPTAPTAAQDKNTSWMIGQAVQAGAQEFAAKNPDYADHQEKMGEYLQSIGWNAARVLETNDPTYAQTETARVLTEAYWHVQAEVQATRQAELKEKRAVQTAKLKTAKQRAAPSATGATPPPKPREKTQDEMSEDELEKAMEKAVAGQRWY